MRLKVKEKSVQQFQGKIGTRFRLSLFNIELANLQISKDNNRRIKQQTN